MIIIFYLFTKQDTDIIILNSKQHLFDLIMIDCLQNLISAILYNLNNKELSLSTKIDMVVNRYLDVLTENPHIPIFVLSELRDNSSKFLQRIKIPTYLLKSSHANGQIEKQIEKQKLPGSSLHYIVNVLSMTILPIALKDLLEMTYSNDPKQYNIFIEERRLLIPIWIKTILKLED